MTSFLICLAAGLVFGLTAIVALALAAAAKRGDAINDALTRHPANGTATLTPLTSNPQPHVRLVTPDESA